MEYRKKWICLIRVIMAASVFAIFVNVLLRRMSRAEWFEGDEWRVKVQSLDATRNNQK